MKLPATLLIGVSLGVAIGAAATVIAINARAPEEAAAGRPGGFRGGYAPAVTLVTAQGATVGKTIDVIGEARALKSVTLTSEATGIVTSVNIAPGKKVSEDDILLRLDDKQQRIALDRARAQYPIAKANADRYASLNETEAASALEAEAAFNNFKSVEADLRAAEFDMEQRTMRAPFNGVIGLTDIEPGDYLRAGDKVTTLDDTSSILVEFAVPQEAAAAVSLGQPVTARLASGGDNPHMGEVTAIDSRVDPASRTLRIEATFSNDDGGLLPGAIFAISTTSEGAAAVAVPGLSVQWDRSGPYVWRRRPTGEAERVSVVILQRTDDIVLLGGELRPGDIVVSEGADRVRPSMKLPAPEENRQSAAGTAVTGASGE